MTKVLALFFSSWLWLTLAMLLHTSFAETSAIAKPGCPTKCGEVTIPYPFGLTQNQGCSFSKLHTIHCNTSFNPPKPFFIGKDILLEFMASLNDYDSTTIRNETSLEIIDISTDGQMRIKNSVVASTCYENRKVVRSNTTSDDEMINFNNLPVVLSQNANKFFVVSCNDSGSVIPPNRSDFQYGTCVPTCYSLEEMQTKHKNSPCTLGIGCCQAPIPAIGMKFFDISTTAGTYNDSGKNVSADVTIPFCTTAFIGEEDTYSFNVDDISLSNHEAFLNRTMEKVPLVLDWYVGVGETCQQAKLKPSKLGYACKENTNCTDVFVESGTGYRCNCLPGYQGNPYLSPGCKKIDACDGLKSGDHCFTRSSIVGISLGFLLLLALVYCIYLITKRRKLQKIREKFFELNGGLLLIKQLSPNGETSESFKIYYDHELKVATNNYNEDCVLGKGGYGIVYKGISKDGHELAVKKSKLADETQVEQFINELVILTQINHRNVVKLLGCCLETEVPLIIYEFVSNGTLFDHIHGDRGKTYWLNWANCIRIAVEAADAIAYLHSAASTPIIHRDIKSTNILLDENHTTKISDFGSSKLIPIDQTRGTTLVQGTLGYLDPEYFHTSHLTEKSDVYSFGVVLAELLTKQKPLSQDRKPEETNLATFFIISVKENRLMEILDPQLVKEATEEQLITMAKLVCKCLNVMGKERPTMKEVAIELEELRKQINYYCSDQNYKGETYLMGQQNDLYPVPSDCYSGNPSTEDCSGQYSMERDMITEMNHPR